MLFRSFGKPFPISRAATLPAKTRQRVLGALDKLSQERSEIESPLSVRLFCESGETFNAAMAAAAAEVNRSVPGASIEAHYVTTSQLEPGVFGRRIEHDGSEADGVVVVAREHPAINRAIRKLRSVGMPVVCLTTDLPSSRRSTYVGNVAVAVVEDAIDRGRSHIRELRDFADGWPLPSSRRPSNRHFASDRDVYDIIR